MKNIKIQAITNMGCVVYAGVKVNNNTIEEITEAVKARGFKAYRTMEMRKFVFI